METVKQHKVGYPNSSKEGEPVRMFRFALFVGIASMALAILIATASYFIALKSAEQEFHRYYMGQADMLVSAATLKLDLSDSELLSHIQQTWSSVENRPADEYLCITDTQAVLLLHSAAPETVGKCAATNALLGSGKNGARNLQELIDAKIDYVGVYISSAGEEQIAAFSYFPGKDWVVGVHRSKSALDLQVRRSAIPLVIGFAVVILLLLPISLVLNHQAFTGTLEKAKEAEQSAVNSGLLLKSHIDHTPIGVIQWNLEFEVAAWNPAAEHIFGYQARDAIGHHATILIIPGGAREHVDEIWAGLLAQSGGSHSINENFKSDGSTIMCEWFNTPLRDNAGKVYGVASMVADVTQRLQAEAKLAALNEELRSTNEELTGANEELESQYEELNAATHDLVESQGLLQRSESQLQLSIQNMPIAFIIWDTQWRVIEWNNEAENIFGYSKEETLGKNGIELIVPEPAHHLVDGLMQDLQQGNSVHFSEPNNNIRKDGKSISCKWYNTPLANESGEVYAVMSMAEDISEQKQAEQQLERLSTAIQQAAESIVITDQEGSIQYVNPAFCTITGYSEDEAIGNNPRILKSGHHDDSFYQELWGTLCSGKPWHGRFVNKKKDGTLYHEEATISPVFDPLGQIINYVAVKRDTTQEIHLEEQLRQTQKMEAMGTLAGGIAHDFNNILFAIQGYTELAANSIPKGNPATEDLKQVISASKRAAELVKQILTFARKTEQKRGPMQVGPIVREVVKLMRSTLPTTIDIIQRQGSMPTTVIADPTEIHQVVMNLCTNAGQAMMENGGELKVGLAVLEADEILLTNHPDLKSGPHLILSVSDTGPGMGPEVQQRIFEPFFTTKAAGEGTGLGLAVAHGIITDLGGYIDVTSEVGLGTVFTVFIPMAVTRSSQKTPIATRLPRGSELVMVVDDETILATMIKNILENLGYEVEAFSNSEQALAEYLAAPNRYDLIITDQTMPKLTGAELAKQVLAKHPGQPVILCTGFSQIIPKEKAENLGIAAYLSKPVSKRDLAEAIRRVLDGD